MNFISIRLSLCFIVLTVERIYSYTFFVFRIVSFLYCFELVVSDDNVTRSHYKSMYIYVIVQKKRVVVMMYYLTASSLDAHFYCVPSNKRNSLFDSSIYVRVCIYVAKSCSLLLLLFLLLMVFDVHLLPVLGNSHV